MKKYYFITLLAIIIITLLQGYNISLQYREYIHNQVDAINTALKVSIDEEYAKRAHKNRHSHKDGKQRLFYKVMNKADIIKAKPKKEDILRFDEINIQDLREKGIAETETEAIGLISQDLMTTRKNPLNLSVLSAIFKKNLNKGYSYSLLILDEQKHIMQQSGETTGIGKLQYSKPIAIGLRPIRFVKAVVNIPPSSFIINSVSTLVLTLVLACIIIICIGYQMTVIRNKEKLLRNREVSIHGTIHDLKAPLSSTLLLLGIIKDYLTDYHLIELMDKAERQIFRLSTTIKTILITAKAGEGKLILNKEPINLVEIANTAKENIEIDYKSNPHKICITDNRIIKQEVVADKYLIENIVQNLLENAIKYSEANTQIDITLTEAETFAVIAVKDQGIGIDQKYQKKIFKQFYRIPISSHKKGYGIGLALVKYAVEAHNGTIKIYSEPGKGSTFVFTLPTNKK